MRIQINTDNTIAGHEELNAHQAVDEAAQKLTHLIDSTVGRQDHERSHRTAPTLPAAEVPEET